MTTYRMTGGDGLNDVELVEAETIDPRYSHLYVTTNKQKKVEQMETTTEKKTVNIQDLTPEQIKALHAQLLEQEKEEQEKRKADRIALASLENDAVIEIFDEVETLSNAIVNFKKKCIEKMQPLMRLKTELAKAAKEQKSFTFSTKDKSAKVVIDYNETMKFDDGIHAAMESAKEWLESKASGSEDMKIMTNIVENLLGQSRTGTYSTDKLLVFVSSVEKYDDELLNKAADAVKQSLSKEMTSVSVRVFKKDEFGQMRQLPLSATKA